MRKAVLALWLSVLLAACAPGALGPPPTRETYTVGPYPTTPRAAEPGADGVYAKLGPEGLSLGLRQGPLAGELVGVGGWVGGAKARGSWHQGGLAVAAEGAYLYYEEERFTQSGYETVEHRLVGVAADASYTRPVPVGHGEAYVGPRLRAYWSFEKVGGGPYRSAHAGLLPGVVLGVNLPVPATGDRLTFGLEAALFLVSPWLSSEPEWSAFSPLSMTFSYRF